MKEKSAPIQDDSIPTGRKKNDAIIFKRRLKMISFFKMRTSKFTKICCCHFILTVIYIRFFNDIKETAPKILHKRRETCCF